MIHNPRRKTARKTDEWTVEPVIVAEREALAKAFAFVRRRIVELETELKAAESASERSIS